MNPCLTCIMSTNGMIHISIFTVTNGFFLFGNFSFETFHFVLQKHCHIFILLDILSDEIFFTSFIQMVEKLQGSRKNTKQLYYTELCLISFRPIVLKSLFSKRFFLFYPLPRRFTRKIERKGQISIFGEFHGGLLQLNFQPQTCFGLFAVLTVNEISAHSTST